MLSIRSIYAIAILVSLSITAALTTQTIKRMASSGLNKIHANVENFDEKLVSLQGKPVYICFMSNWCPDCKAVPGIESGLESAAHEKLQILDLLLVDVGPTKEIWKSLDHPFRSHR